jgi:hypothetical protein
MKPGGWSKISTARREPILNYFDKISGQLTALLKAATLRSRH